MIQSTLNENGELSSEEIAYIINNTDLDKFTTNIQYYSGNDTAILSKADPDDSTFPNNKIPVPYGRKVAETTKNYMFNRPIVYTAENDEYIKTLSDIMFSNDNQLKAENLGEDLIVFGVAYKLFYFKEGEGKFPSYSVVDGREIIPVYDYSIEPNLISGIRFYVIPDYIDSTKTKTMIEVYYNTIIVRYEVDGVTVNETTMARVDEKPHGFMDVPLVVYGDEYQIGVFEPVIKIIDAIDNITSQDMNEIDKFELAYLVLTGQKIDPEDKDKIKERRFFELEQDSTLKYLMKEIDGEFRKNVLEYLVSEIHKQSGVPDFASKDFAAESGIALLYKLMGFENLAASIEKIFKEGEQESIFIINSTLYNAENKQKFLIENPDKIVKILMSRNIPQDTKGKLEEANISKNLGLSMGTILDNLPFIESTEDELEKINKQSEENFNRFNEMQNVASENKIEDVENEKDDVDSE